MFRMEKSSLWSKYCGRLLVYQTLRPNRSSLVFNSDQSIRVACNAGQVSSWRSGTLFSRVITTLNFRKLKDLHEGEIKKGGGEEAGREKRTSPSLRSRFLTLTPTLLVATSTLLKSSSVFRITVGSLCTDAPLPSEGRGGEGRGASVHRIKVGGDNFDRLKNTPTLKATIRGPFHREMGLDASIDPKASIREKNRLIYHTSI